MTDVQIAFEREQDVRRATDWPPTAEQINALPENVRRYIHHLETVCDPAGDVRRMALLEVENECLRLMVAEVAP